MAEAERHTPFWDRYERAAELRYGPRTWFGECRAAAADGPAGVAGLLAQLAPGHEVAEALGTESSRPGQDRLLAAPRSLADPAGAALSAARAMAEVAAVLGGTADPGQRLVSAIEHWRQANILPRVPLTGSDIGLAGDDAALSIALRRLAVVADELAPDTAAGAGLAALLARALREELPPVVRELELPVLFDLRSTGGHGRLRISCLRGGPRGLYPDPRSMLFLVTDPPFAQALDAAWRTAPGRLSGQCLVWCLTAGGQPCDKLLGGSLGAAFGVGLAELGRAAVWLGGVTPRRLDRRCAVSAGLSPSGALFPVRGERNKLETAVAQRWRVVLAGPPAARGTVDTPTEDLVREARVRYAARLPIAVRLTRTRVNSSFVVMLTAVLIAAGTVTAGALAAAHQLDQAHLQALGSSLIRDASDPGLSQSDSLLLYSLATQIDAPGARAGLVHELLNSRYAGGLPRRVSPCGGPQAWSPDGTTLATAGPTGVTLWDVQRQQEERFIQTAAPVTSCSFAPDGATLAIASGGRLLLSRPGTRQPASPGGTGRTGRPSDMQQVQFARDGVLATLSFAGRVRLWQIDSSGTAAARVRLLGIVPASGGGGILTFSPDSHTIAFGGPQGIILADVADPRAPRIVGSIPGNDSSAAFSPDGVTLAVGESGGTTVLWQVGHRAQPRARVSILPRQPTGQPVDSVAFTPDSEDLIISNELGEIWAVGGANPPRFVQQLTTGPNEINEADLAPGGTVAAVADVAGNLTFWRLSNQLRPVAAATLPIRPAAVSGLAFPTGGGPTLAVTTVGGGLSLWNIADPAHPHLARASGPHGGMGILGRNSAPGPALFSADGRRIVMTVGSALRVWDITAGGRITPAGLIRAPAGSAYTPSALSSDGSTLAAANEQSQLALWDLRETPHLLSTLPAETGATLSDQALVGASFSPDGRTLVTDGEDGTISWWDITRPADPVLIARRVKYTQRAVTLAYTADGRLMAVAEGGSPGLVWDTTTPSAPALLSNRPGVVDTFTLNAEFSGRALTVGTMGAISVWDVTDPANPVLVTQFASGGTGPFNGRLAVSGNDLLATTQLASPSSFYSGLTVVKLWNLKPILSLISDPVAAACRTDGGQLSPAMWQRYAPSLPHQPICR